MQGLLEDVYATGPGMISVTNTELEADNYMISLDGPSLDVEGCQFDTAQGTSADIYLDMSSSLRLRDSSLLEPAGYAIWINGDYGNIDLGTSSDPGGNTFSQGQTVMLYVAAADDGDIHASGNNWIPNDSGSDASGHFPVGTSRCGPFNPTPGENFQLNSTQCLLF
jgi:hypothetical protein